MQNTLWNSHIQFRRTISLTLKGLEKGVRDLLPHSSYSNNLPSATVGEGCLVAHNLSVVPKQGFNFNMLNSRCTIGHDSILGEFNLFIKWY